MHGQSTSQSMNLPEFTQHHVLWEDVCNLICLQNQPTSCIWWLARLTLSPTQTQQIGLRVSLVACMEHNKEQQTTYQINQEGISLAQRDNELSGET